MPIKLHSAEEPTLNLTPMIDIVFLLIIFFMVGTKFTEIEQELEVSIPEVASGATVVTKTQQCVIAVFHDGRVSVDDDVMEIHELEENLNRRVSGGAELHVIIRGDAEGAFQNVANVLSACRRAGVNDLGISVRMASRE
ncbi:MAG: biopolymer transporter ExbD [Pirellulaceae bacterium]|jgi:biopolymer transport protein ExbD|nr:biopolymer transporter ExbD [Pirellulaceae bacterium]